MKVTLVPVDEAKPVRLVPIDDKEQEFRDWYSGWAKKSNLNPNPDEPKHFYDYRAAHEVGAQPDASGHWPSQFKKPGHPNQFVDGFNTITGQPVLKPSPPIQPPPPLGGISHPAVSVPERSPLIPGGSLDQPFGKTATPIITAGLKKTADIPVGLAETVTTFAEAIPAMSVGGLSYFRNLLDEAVLNVKNGKPVDWKGLQDDMHNTMAAWMPYQPQTEFGKTTTDVAAAPFTAGLYGVQKGSEAITSDPGKQAMIQGIVEAGAVLGLPFAGALKGRVVRPNLGPADTSRILKPEPIVAPAGPQPRTAEDYSAAMGGMPDWMRREVMPQEEAVRATEPTVEPTAPPVAEPRRRVRLVKVEQAPTPPPITVEPTATPEPGIPTVNDIQAQRTKVANLEMKLKKMTGMVPPPIRKETSDYLEEQQAKLDGMRTIYNNHWEQKRNSAEEATIPPPVETNPTVIGTKPPPIETLEPPPELSHKPQAAPQVSPITHDGDPVTTKQTEEFLKSASPLKPAEQKKYLIGEIDKAIEEAPDTQGYNLRSESLIKSRIEQMKEYVKQDIPERDKRVVLDGISRLESQLTDTEAVDVGTIHIDVPGDGTFDVINTQEKLGLFKQMVEKKFPGSTSKGIDKTKLKTPSTKPAVTTRGLEEGIEKSDYHTNGHLALKGPPKIPFKSPMERQGTTPETFKEVSQKLIGGNKSGEIVTKTDYLDKGSPDDIEIEAISDQPVPNMTGLAVVRLGGEKGTESYVDQSYYLYILKHYPDATFELLGAERPVIVKDNGAIVGFVMPKRTKESGLGGIRREGETATGVPPKGTKATKETKGKKSQADMGGYADTGGHANAGPQGARPAAGPGDYATEMKTPLEMPEIVDIARELGQGRLPRIMRAIRAAGGQALGAFYPGKERIELRADIYKDPYLAARVLAHEIGHWIDLVGDIKSMDRGNILGSIASLKNYMKDLLAGYPGGPKILTDKDRDRIRNLAKKETEEAQPQTVTRKVPIMEEVPLTPDEILAVWRDVMAREKDPKLNEYIARLSNEQKKSIVKEALKGRVADWVTFKKMSKIGEREVTETIQPEHGRVAYLKRYHEMIREEIIKRGLYERGVITDELKTLTHRIKPFNKATAKPSFIEYRYSPRELYADAFSTLINDPELLKQIAPTFYKAFFSWIGQKPEVKAIYDKIQERVKPENRPALLEERRRGIREMFREGERIREEKAQKEKTTVSDFTHAVNRALIDENADIIRKMKQYGGQAELRHTLEERPYIPSEILHYRTAVEKEVISLLEKAGVTIEDIGEYMFYRRSATERAGLANPRGHGKVSADEGLDLLRREIGDEKYQALEDGVKHFWELRQENVIRVLEEEGMFSDALMKKINDNENYATFNVLSALQDTYGSGSTAHIFKQIGTLQDIENPFVATVLKDASLIRAARLNKIKRGISTFLKDVDGSAKAAESRWNGRYHEMMESKDRRLGLVVYSDNGKIKGILVPKEIAETLNKNPQEAGIIAKVWQTIHVPVRGLLVTHNPAWVIFNMMRDFQGTVKNIPGMTMVKAFRYYRATLREAASNAFLGKETPNISRMFKDKEIVPGRFFEARDLSVDAQMERILSEIGNNPKKYKNFIIKPFAKLWDYLGRLGLFSERWAKLAGSQALEKEGIATGKRKAHLVRTRVGTPDIYRRGTWNPVMNNLFMFSNVSKEGWRASFEAFQESADIKAIKMGKSKAGAWEYARSEYTWKTIKYNLIPKLVVFAGLAGAFGEDIKKILKGVGKYFRDNYTIFPIGLTLNGKSVFMTLPQDYTGQVIGGAFNNLINGNFIGKGGLLDYGATQSPYNLSPVAEVALDVAQYALRDINPTDSYYGTPILDKDVAEAGGPRAWKDLAKYASNQLGGSMIYRFKSNTVEGVQGELEKYLQYPGMNFAGRILRVSDQGLKEELRDVTKEAGKKEARRVLEVRDRITESINSITEDGKQPQEKDIMDLYLSLRKEELIEPTITGKEFRHRYNRYLARGSNNLEVDAVIQAKTTAEKATLITHYRETKPHDQYREILVTLKKEGYYPKEALTKSLIDNPTPRDR